MNSMNLQVVKEAFAAMGRGDTDSLLKLCAQDIEWFIPGEWALSGLHRGHVGLLDLLEKSSRLVETTFLGSPEFVAQGNRVLVLGTSLVKVKATQKSFEDHFVYAITVQAGQLAAIREYMDTLAAERVFQNDSIHPQGENQ